MSSIECRQLSDAPGSVAELIAESRDAIQRKAFSNMRSFLIEDVIPSVLGRFASSLSRPVWPKSRMELLVSRLIALFVSADAEQKKHLAASEGAVAAGSTAPSIEQLMQFLEFQAADKQLEQALLEPSSDEAFVANVMDAVQHQQAVRSQTPSQNSSEVEAGAGDERAPSQSNTGGKKNTDEDSALVAKLDSIDKDALAPRGGVPDDDDEEAQYPLDDFITSMDFEGAEDDIGDMVDSTESDSSGTTRKKSRHISRTASRRGSHGPAARGDDIDGRDRPGRQVWEKNLFIHRLQNRMTRGRAPDIIVNPLSFPGLQIGDIVELEQAAEEPVPSVIAEAVGDDDADAVPSSPTSSAAAPAPGASSGATLPPCRVVLQVTRLEAIRGNLEISILSTIAQKFGFKSRRSVKVRVVPPDQVRLDFIELSFRDQYISRSEMWRLKAKLLGTCVHIDKTVTVLGMRAQIEQMLMNNTSVSCGLITSETKFVFRSLSARVFLLLQMSEEAWDCAEDGELLYEKMIGFLRILFDKWKTGAGGHPASHNVSIVLFSRTFYFKRRSTEPPVATAPTLSPTHKPRTNEDPVATVLSLAAAERANQSKAHDTAPGAPYPMHWDDPLITVNSDLLSSEPDAGPHVNITTEMNFSDDSDDDEHDWHADDDSFDADDSDDLDGIDPADVMRSDRWGRLFQDHYKLVADIDLRSGCDWMKLLVRLKKEFVGYRDLLQWNRPDEHGVTGKPSLSADGNLLEVLNLCVSVFDKHYIDRDLNHTGQNIIIVTPGSGLFRVDPALSTLTKQRIIDNGIANDLICVSRPPLHAAPLFDFRVQLPAWQQPMPDEEFDLIVASYSIVRRELELHKRQLSKLVRSLSGSAVQDIATAPTPLPSARHSSSDPVLPEAHLLLERQLANKRAEARQLKRVILAEKRKRKLARVVHQAEQRRRNKVQFYIPHWLQVKYFDYQDYLESPFGKLLDPARPIRGPTWLPVHLRDAKGQQTQSQFTQPGSDTLQSGNSTTNFVPMPGFRLARGVMIGSDLAAAAAAGPRQGGKLISSISGSQLGADMRYTSFVPKLPQPPLPIMEEHDYTTYDMNVFRIPDGTDIKARSRRLALGGSGGNWKATPSWIARAALPHSQSLTQITESAVAKSRANQLLAVTDGGSELSSSRQSSGELSAPSRRSSGTYESPQFQSMNGRPGHSLEGTTAGFLVAAAAVQSHSYSHELSQSRLRTIMNQSMMTDSMSPPPDVGRSHSTSNLQAVASAAAALAQHDMRPLWESTHDQGALDSNTTRIGAAMGAWNPARDDEPLRADERPASSDDDAVFSLEMPGDGGALSDGGDKAGASQQRGLPFQRRKKKVVDLEPVPVNAARRRTSQKRSRQRRKSTGSSNEPSQEPLEGAWNTTTTIKLSQRAAPSVSRTMMVSRRSKRKMLIECVRTGNFESGLYDNATPASGPPANGVGGSGSGVGVAPASSFSRNTSVLGADDGLPDDIIYDTGSDSSLVSPSASPSLKHVWSDSAMSVDDDAGLASPSRASGANTDRRSGSSRRRGTSRFPPRAGSPQLPAGGSSLHKSSSGSYMVGQGAPSTLRRGVTKAQIAREYGQSLNPFTRIGQAPKFNSNLRRWSHLFATVENLDCPLLPNWKGLTNPAILPLTTDYFPDDATLRRDYLEYMHTLSLVEGDNVFENRTENVLAELICQRLAQDYQLATNVSASSAGGALGLATLATLADVGSSTGGGGVTGGVGMPTSTGGDKSSATQGNSLAGGGGGGGGGSQSSSSAGATPKSVTPALNETAGGLAAGRLTVSTHLLSFSDEFHSIRLDPESGNMVVKRYLSRSREQERTDQVHNSYPYRYFLWDDRLHGFGLQLRELAPNHEAFNWNLADQLLSGYHNEFSSDLKQRRVRYAIVPLRAADRERLGEKKWEEALVQRNRNFRRFLRHVLQREHDLGVVTVRDPDERAARNRRNHKKQLEEAWEAQQRELQHAEEEQEKHLSQLLKTLEVPAQHPRAGTALSPSPGLSPPVGPVLNEPLRSTDRHERGFGARDVPFISTKVNLKARRDRYEWIMLRHDKMWDPTVCFHLEIQWLAATGVHVSDWIAKMRRKARICQLPLLLIPTDRPSLRSDPFHATVNIPLYDWTSLEIFMDALIHRFGFVIDAPPAKGVQQLIHHSGQAAVRCTPEGVAWINNILETPNPFKSGGNDDGTASGAAQGDQDAPGALDPSDGEGEGSESGLFSRVWRCAMGLVAAREALDAMINRAVREAKQ